MSNEDETYNGWTNRSTWGVQLRISNDYGFYHYWREMARRCIEEFGDSSAVDALADRMCRELKGSPFSEVDDWSAVNWQEIAASWVSEELEDMKQDGAGFMSRTQY